MAENAKQEVPDVAEQAPPEAPDALEPEGATAEEALQQDGLDEPEPEVAADEPINPAIARMINEARSEAREAREALQQIREQNRRPEPEDVPPVDPNNIQTMDELRRYNEWLIKKEISGVSRVASISANHAAAEQRARGLLSAEAMGTGYDYDSMITKHIAPVERQNPATRDLFMRQADPALARFAMAVMLESIEKFGGDPAKGFRQILHAMGSASRGNAEVFNKIKQGTSRAAVLRGTVRKSGPSGATLPTYTAEQVEKATPRRYIEMKGEVKAGKARWAAE